LVNNFSLSGGFYQHVVELASKECVQARQLFLVFFNDFWELSENKSAGRAPVEYFFGDISVGCFVEVIANEVVLDGSLDFTPEVDLLDANAVEKLSES
jgi:hypothetical protein